MTPKQYAAARAHLCLSHAELAEKLGIHRITSRSYEVGRLAVPRLVELAISHLKIPEKVRAKYDV